MNALKTVTAAAALMLVAGAAHVTSGAELQESCLQPPATVIELTGINSSHARARAKYTEPDIIKACHEGYVYQRGWSPEECIRQTKLDLLGHEISAEANCAQGTLRLEGLGRLLFKMPVHGDCATGGIFAVPTFKMLCPQYRGRIENPL
jgi:hypothetical protein